MGLRSRVRALARALTSPPAPGAPAPPAAPPAPLEGPRPVLPSPALRPAGRPPVQAPPARPEGVVAADLAAVRGATSGRRVLEHHWATWCEPCEEELPLVQRLAQAVHGALVGVSWEAFEAMEEPAALVERVARYQAERGLTFPTVVYLGEPEALFDGLALGFERIPQTRLLAADGTVLAHVRGPMSPDDVDRLAALFQESP